MELITAFERMLTTVSSPAQVRAIERGASIAPLWEAVEASGYLDALVPEADGGAGLSLADVYPLWQALGRFAVPAPVAETMVARGLSGADPTDRRIGAIIAAAAIAGGADRLLAMTIEYANQRVQFGKPIARQQAIQHQLAVMAEQCVLARIAAQIGCSQGLVPPLAIAATAKHVASAAAIQISAIAHAVHGAIGISEAHDLHLYTRALHRWRIAHGSESYWARRLGALQLAAPATPVVDYIRLTIA